VSDDDSQREVVVRRLSHANHEATNVRGGTLLMGTGDTSDFTPVELLLAAVAGCTGLDVDFITSRRAEPESFSVAVRGRKVKDEHGNHLEGLEVTFHVVFPEGPEGDQARTALPMAVSRSHDRLCTVSRTVELGAPISTTIADPAVSV
jgi:putative redox protein